MNKIILILIMTGLGVGIGVGITRTGFDIRSLIAPQPEPTVTLQRAVREGSIDEIQKHIKAGTLIDERDVNGWTALNYAVLDGGNKEIASLLIDHGANVNNTDVTGRTVLQYAEMEGDKLLVSLLEAKGATKMPQETTPEPKNIASDTAWRATGSLIKKDNVKAVE